MVGAKVFSFIFSCWRLFLSVCLVVPLNNYKAKIWLHFLCAGMWFRLMVVVVVDMGCFRGLIDAHNGKMLIKLSFIYKTFSLLVCSGTVWIVRNIQFVWSWTCHIRVDVSKLLFFFLAFVFNFETISLFINVKFMMRRL